jgi:ATP-binding cassette subfamily B protein/ATP-binding cassette subfamily C protein
MWLRQPDLMVLDEATARVDPQTEQLLEQAVTKLTAGRTTLIIAHRLSTLRAVDHIVVVEHGRVVEFGRRQDLADDPTSHFHRLLALALDSTVTLDELDLSV